MINLVHPPKTGGRSLAKLIAEQTPHRLSEQRQMHLRADQMTEADWTVVTVRDPFERMVSLYVEFIVERRKTPAPPSAEEFRRFAVSPYHKSIGRGTNIKASIFEFIVGARGPVSYLRFHRFEEDARTLFGDVAVPHVGQRNYDLHNYYDEPTHRFVAQQYARDVELMKIVEEYHA